MKNEKFLPIGSVVMLKGGTKPTMITSYCIIPKGDIYDKNGPVDKEKITNLNCQSIYEEIYNIDVDSIKELRFE